MLTSLQGIPGYDEQAFEAVHASGEQVTSIRINPAKPALPRTPHTSIPWAANGYYLGSRPSFTFDPLFHAGCYYVQEASSMLLEQALLQTTDISKPLKVLDLCAAPGGKSTHLQSLLSPGSMLVSNEVIRSRAMVLRDNIIKWGSTNVVVTNNDPEHFSALDNYFDIIVVDAPCSGSGLFRRDPDAIDEWSENNVALCSQRQQRILMDVWPALKKGGLLIYSTCSYSKEEDELLVDKITNELPATSYRLQTQDWKITEVQSAGGSYGYRCWPHLLKGEGFFLACFRKEEGEEEQGIRARQKPDRVSKKEMPYIEPWINTTGLSFIKQQQTIYAWPEHLMEDISWLKERLRLVYSGTLAGELVRDKLVPDHALALSTALHPAVRRIEVPDPVAVQYLQRKDISLTGAEKGWQVLCSSGFPIGWVNVLANRVNNYYPKELRILKERE